MDNPIHLFVFHYVFKARINETLRNFVSGWNKHPVRTERNWSPVKIWSNGMIDLRNSNRVQVAELQNNNVGGDDLTWYGFDPHAPTPNDSGLEQVEVIDAQCPLNEDQISRLSDVDITKSSSNFGIDVFFAALASVT